MTEIATDEAAPDLPPPSAPRRGRSPSAAGGTGAAAAAVVCAALLAAAGWFAWRPVRLNAILRDLTSADPAARKAAEDRLPSSKEAVVALLPELSASPSPAQRRRAVRAASALDLKDDPAGMDLLKRAASDPDPSVREDAMACLGRFANAGSTEALKALLDLTRQSAKDGADVPPGLIEALGEAAPPSEQGRSLLADQGLDLLGHPSPKVRSALLRSLGMALLGRTGEPSPETNKLLHGLLASAADPDAEVRAALDAVLRQMQGPKAVPFALGALDHPDPWVRLWGETTLRVATGKSAGYDPFGPEAERRAAAEQWKGLAKP